MSKPQIPTHAKKRKVYFARNSKGGVGKSSVLATLIFLMHLHDDDVSIIDTDVANPDIYKSHHARYQSHKLSLDSEDGYTSLAGLIARAPGDVMVSGAAGGQELFAEYAPVVNHACHMLGLEVHVLWPIDLDIDSYVSLTESVEAMPDAQFWVIRNYIFGRSEGHFAAWNSSQTAKPFFEMGRVLNLPPIPAAAMRCFKTQRMSFAQVLESGDVDLISALEIWGPRARKALSPLIDGIHAS